MQNKTISFSIDMEPRAAHRFRVSFKQRRVYEPDMDTDYKSDMRKIVTTMLPSDFTIIDDAFEIEIKVYVKIPTAFNKAKRAKAISGELRPTTKPDTDNYAKLMLDAFNGFLYTDDKLNTDLIVRKYYSENQHIDITIKY